MEGPFKVSLRTSRNVVCEVPGEFDDATQAREAGEAAHRSLSPSTARPLDGATGWKAVVLHLDHRTGAMSHTMFSDCYGHPFSSELQAHVYACALIAEARVFIDGLDQDAPLERAWIVGYCDACDRHVPRAFCHPSGDVDLALCPACIDGYSREMAKETAGQRA